MQIVSEELVKLMGGKVSELSFAKSGPTVILLAGLQGVGKTTVSAKLAVYLKKQVFKNLFFFSHCEYQEILTSAHIRTIIFVTHYQSR